MAGESEGGSTSWGNNYGRPSQSVDEGRTWADESGSVTTYNNGNINWNNNDGTSGNYSNLSSQFAQPGLFDNWNSPGYSFLNSLFGNAFKQDVDKVDALGDKITTLPNINFNAGEGTESERAQYLTGLAEQAKTGKGTFASLLGREPTRAELQQLSDQGYSGMYGVNPNNMEGQTIGNMLAAQKTGDFIGKVGNAAISAAMPAPMSLAINGTRAWQEYQKTGNWQDALAKVLGTTGGYTGAIGQAMQGNYGNAVTSALSRGGAAPITALAAGTGVDAAQGKDVSNNLGSIAGYTLGNAAGKGYGGLGQTLGRSFLPSLFRK